MVNYLQKFSPNLAQITAPMRALFKKYGIMYRPMHLKKKIMLYYANPLLAYNDAKKFLTLECDALKLGIGVATIHDRRLIAYSSKTLTPT